MDEQHCFHGAAGTTLQGRRCRDGAAGTTLQGRCCRDGAAGMVLQGWCCRDDAAAAPQHTKTRVVTADSSIIHPPITTFQGGCFCLGITTTCGSRVGDSEGSGKKLCRAKVNLAQSNFSHLNCNCVLFSATRGSGTGARVYIISIRDFQGMPWVPPVDSHFLSTKSLGSSIRFLVRNLPSLWDRTLSAIPEHLENTHCCCTDHTPQGGGISDRSECPESR